MYKNKIAFLTLAIKNNPLDLSKKSEWEPKVFGRFFNNSNNKESFIKLGKGKSNIGRSKYSEEQKHKALLLSYEIGVRKAGKITGMGSTGISKLRSKYLKNNNDQFVKDTPWKKPSK